MGGHGLTIEDRGLQHIHRWLPVCSCGWSGVSRRRRREAAKQYHQHVEGIEARARLRRGPDERRHLTPVADLPEGLR